ncbi:hypothetical protein [Nitrosomonas mobilis]|uniref:Uncharacterized protein n=1 Tax=Nitrosomonas mobilis TaxID=51642 RepID=A0A1G5SBC1_9PROT|nr:hypothetical protein [Nitrosomonas mobilis]SCZ84452.1 conserved exported hypothetical protein [Nitrosomonas mobilis]
MLNMNAYRLKKIAIMIIALSWWVSNQAIAAPPTNDTFTNSTPVTVGFSEVLDTTEATTDSDDALLNTSCGAPASDASVWYSFNATSDTNVVVDVSQSNYSAGVLVGEGSQDNLQTIACGPGAVPFFATAGTTYYVLAIDDQLDGGGNGGLLSISFNEVAPTTLDDFTVNPVGIVNIRTGVATISGTYTCNNGDFLGLFGDASQNVGRIATIRGDFFFFDSGTCNGTSHPWSGNVVPQNGKFAGGKAMTMTFAFTCGPFQCADGYIEQKIQLRGGKK